MPELREADAPKIQKITSKRNFRVSVISATMRIALRSNFLISNYLNHVLFHDGNDFFLVTLRCFQF